MGFNFYIIGHSSPYSFIAICCILAIAKPLIKKLKKKTKKKLNIRSLLGDLAPPLHDFVGNPGFMNSHTAGRAIFLN